MLYILSGEKDCGKTSIVSKLIEEHGIAVQGFLSHQEKCNGKITGISLLVFPGRRPFPMATTYPIRTKERTSRFYFYPRVFDLVNRHFHKIIPDLPFIFDEFGSLEMGKRGHYPIFSLLKKIRQKTLMIVRNSLLESFISMYCGNINYSVLNVDDCSKRYASKSILDFLIGQQQSCLY